MAIFAIIKQPNPKQAQLDAEILSMFPDAFRLEGQAGWLISAQTSAQNLSERLHITDGSNGGAVVVEVSSYFGRANPNTWTWLKEKMEAASNG